MKCTNCAKEQSIPSRSDVAGNALQLPQEENQYFWMGILFPNLRRPEALWHSVAALPAPGEAVVQPE